MENLFRFLLICHICGGTLALFVGPGAMLTVKGMRWHRRWGKIFVASMAVVAASAVPMTLIHPNPFLALIAVFSFYLTWSGWRVLRRKRPDFARDGQWRLDMTVTIFGLLAAAFLLGWGAFRVASHDLFGFVLMVFGVISGRLAWSERRELLRPTASDKTLWLRSHIGRMGGAYIAALTAFSVVNLHQISPLIVWLWPTVLGTPLIARALIARRRPRPAGEPVRRAE